MPIKVMPICTVDRKRPGSAARSSATFAPLRPAFSMACRRGRRADTIASSDMAKMPLSATSARMMTMSTQGKGVGVGEGIVAMVVSCPL